MGMIDVIEDQRIGQINGHTFCVVIKGVTFVDQDLVGQPMKHCIACSNHLGLLQVVP